jgi:hypothetical protein
MNKTEIKKTTIDLVNSGELQTIDEVAIFIDSCRKKINHRQTFTKAGDMLSNMLRRLKNGTDDGD